MNTTERPVLLFDGDCAFCNAFVRWVLRYERRPRYCFASLQSAAAVPLLTRHGIAAGDLSSLVVIDDGRLYRRSDALFHLLREVRWPWPMLRIFAWVPHALRDRAYHYIGANRYRWWGRATSCVLSTPACRSRVLVSEPPVISL